MGWSCKNVSHRIKFLFFLWNRRLTLCTRVCVCLESCVTYYMFVISMELFGGCLGEHGLSLVFGYCADTFFGCWSLAWTSPSFLHYCICCWEEEQFRLTSCALFKKKKKKVFRFLLGHCDVLRSLVFSNIPTTGMYHSQKFLLLVSSIPKGRNKEIYGVSLLTHPLTRVTAAPQSTGTGGRREKSIKSEILWRITLHYTYQGVRSFTIQD